jgi:hypothetical protein
LTKRLDGLSVFFFFQTSSLRSRRCPETLFCLVFFCSEFLTGFSKRKKARSEAARKKAEDAAKVERRELRTQASRAVLLLLLFFRFLLICECTFCLLNEMVDDPYELWLDYQHCAIGDLNRCFFFKSPTEAHRRVCLRSLVWLRTKSLGICVRRKCLLHFYDLLWLLPFSAFHFFFHFFFAIILACVQILTVARLGF